MADEQTFDELLSEFRRVGVDPDTFSAMLALRPEDALRALRALADGAGPSAFLSKLRQQAISPQIIGGEPDVHITPRKQHRRDKTA